jgi:hypothetical protein
MKLNIILATAVAASLCACSPSGSSNSSDDQKRADATETPKEDESKSDWQLHDDSMFIATIDPWPPKEGAVTLKAEATMDDGDQKFAGTVAYRIAASEQSSEPWKPMPKVGEDKDGSLHFAVPATLAKGTVYVQFRVRDKGDKDFTDLTDWKVTVK